jgi:hypothetical protein
LFGPKHQRDLQLSVPFVIEVPLKHRRKHGRLDEPHDRDDTPLAYSGST